MVVLTLLPFVALNAYATWNEEWPTRYRVGVNTTDIAEAVNNASIPVRLHSGNFDFTSVNVDGSDIRVIAADDKTELKFFVEKFDAVNELAIIWVQLPQLSAANKDAHFWIYAGNENAPSASNAMAVVDGNALAKFAFSEKTFLQDISASKLVATGSPTLQKAGLMAESASFNNTPLSITLPSQVDTAQGYAWSAWVKPTTLPQSATLFTHNGALSLVLEGDALHLKAGDVDVTGGQVQAAVWHHVAVTVLADKAVLYLNGVQVAAGNITPMVLGEVLTIGEAFVGELDELGVDKVARSPVWIKLAANSQGVASKLLTITNDGEQEEEGEVNYIGILIDSLTLDAEIVIGILAVMFLISAWVMWVKAVLVSKTDKDNLRFLARFQKSDAQDLLTLDKGANFPNSTLFGLYKAGLREIRKREKEGKELALSGASMDAIKAAIDADLVRETQRLNGMMVLLTIAISGGPFLGLLGTVVGVMITFASISAAGDVNVNAIAPGIAAALLATVAGLAVAIPALFGYNYLASRIKNITISMQIFVDEFVTRAAELFGKE